MRKLLAGSAGVVLALTLATGVLAWGNLTLTAECAADTATYAWTIDLPNENNFKVDWSFDADFATFATVDFGLAGEHQFTTPRSGDILYVRWSSDHDTMAQAMSNQEVCAAAIPPTPEGSVKAGASTPTPEGNVQGGTGTPGAGLPDTSVGAGSSSSAIPASPSACSS